MSEQPKNPQAQLKPMRRKLRRLRGELSTAAADFARVETLLQEQQEATRNAGIAAREQISAETSAFLMDALGLMARAVCGVHESINSKTTETTPTPLSKILLKCIRREHLSRAKSAGNIECPCRYCQAAVDA